MKKNLSLKKRTHVLFLLLALNFSILLAAGTYNEAYYDAITYDWTDASGTLHQGVPLTQKATSTEQIMALLKEVYTNPKVPGTLKGLIANRTSTRNVNYQSSSNSSNLSSNWGIPARSVSDPVEGTTMLFIEFYNSWDKNKFENNIYFNDNGTNYTGKTTAYKAIAECYKSVQLMVGITRIEDSSANPDYNAGTIYNISGTYNRFGFISKGQPAPQNSGYYPLYNMYEEYSPTDGNATTFSNIYDDLSSGKTYAIVHDCASLAHLNHFFAMKDDGTTQQAYNINMCLFVPDYRFNRTGVNYATGYEAQVMSYTVNLTGVATKASAPTQTYDVKLDWKSSFNGLSSSANVAEEFYIYVVENGSISTTPLAGPLNTNTYTYQVSQFPSSQDISYIVSAKPLNSTFVPVFSNVATVTIPGYGVEEKLEISLSGQANSEYDYDDQENNYKNTLTLKNSDVHPILSRELPDASTFTINREWKDALGVENKAAVATIKINSHSTSGTNIVYNYTVTYASIVSGVTYPSTTGTLTSKVSEDGEGVVDFGGGISILDAFSASTALNQQPSQYKYKAIYTMGGNQDGEEDAYSNEVVINILKTNLSLSQTTYTAAQIANDKNRQLPVNNSVDIKFDVSNNPNVLGYMIMRNNVEIGYAQHTQEGNYTLLKRDAAGNLTIRVSDIIFNTGETTKTAIFNDDMYDASLSSDKYVIIIQRKDKINGEYPTYGTNIDEGASLKVSVTLNDKMKNIYYFIDNNGVKGTAYRVEKNITGAITTDLLEFDHFNVWRVINGVETYVDFSNAGTAYQHDYYINQTTDGLNVKCAEAFENKILQNGETLPFTYYVRMYAKVKNLSNSSQTKTLTPDTYLIAEGTINDKFDQDTPTGVSEISSDTNKAMVYPNITSTHTTITGSGEITIYSVSGVKVMTINDGAESRIVDVSSLSTGYYIIKCKGKSMQLVKR